VFAKGAKFSMFKPAEEMVYIGLDEESRTKGKAAIDVAGAQTGKSIGSVLQQVRRTAAPERRACWRANILQPASVMYQCRVASCERGRLGVVDCCAVTACKHGAPHSDCESATAHAVKQGLVFMHSAPLKKQPCAAGAAGGELGLADAVAADPGAGLLWHPARVVAQRGRPGQAACVLL